VFNENLVQICYFQFISHRGNLDHEFATNKTLNYKILYDKYTYTAPQHLILILRIDPLKIAHGYQELHFILLNQMSEVFSTVV